MKNKVAPNKIAPGIEWLADGAGSGPDAVLSEVGRAEGDTRRDFYLVVGHTPRAIAALKEFYAQFAADGPLERK